MAAEADQAAPRRARIPGGIWALGFVSLLMDVSSEMIHALLPIYMVAVLGTSVLAVGIIEGIAEATAAIVKIFSGAISDWLGKRKLLAVIGYGLGAITKPIFPLMPVLEWLVAARFIDRVGKGIRGAPRDALVADIAPKELRGAAFGLRQTLDTIGAFMGPLLAIGFMWMLADNFQAVFWIAVIPGFLSVIVLLCFVREPPRQAAAKPARLPLNRADLARLGRRYWAVVAVAGVFTLARFSEAFLLLRAQEFGLALHLTPLVLVVMSVAYSLSSYPVGVISDRMDRSALLVIGLLLLVAADLVLAFAPNLVVLSLGLVLWGLHMGCSQGLIATLVADAAPPELRGTAFGMLNLLTGLALLVASVLAALLWDGIGSTATFLTGAVFTLLACAGLVLLRRRGLLAEG
ncbi:MFS transporter [Acetobacteraceae bacterium H6797]|nr:MFS transporter [Acetobacteraceae bacterium H6797]